MKKQIMIASMASLIAFQSLLSAGATGLMQCDSGDRSEWKTTDELEAKMIEDGWSVRRIKEDGGCYEAYGTSPEGERVEAYFHPVSLDLLLIARRGQILFKKDDDSN